jgi:sugar phosphate isomerase/epimerase
MNHPMRDPVGEIESIREAGFDFVDLTLEPERARASDLDVRAVRQALARTGMEVVGHTPWYLPLASPFDEIQGAAIGEIERCLDVFAEVGASLVNVHPDSRVSLYDQRWIVERNIQALGRLSRHATDLGLTLMVENLPGSFGRADMLQALFEAVPDLGFHLDVGHANLLVPANCAEDLLSHFVGRLKHVHLSDNKGGDRDLHLPIGAGLIDWRWVVGLLKRFGYDQTITLEVFSPDPDYLAISARKLRRLWAEVA